MQKHAARCGVRALAFLLCLLMVVSLLPVMSASAVDAGAVGTQPAESVTATEGLNMSKQLVLNADGTYTITLEAYATGESQTVTQKSGVPLDIVLVIDQSGSMAYNDSGSSTNTASDRRMEKLKAAVTTFVKNISDNAKEFNVEHKIAMVGYASDQSRGQSTTITGTSYNGSGSYWVNTGLYVNGAFKNYAGNSSTSSLTAQDYKDALVPVNDASGNVTSSITTSIGLLKASGATYTEYGLLMAQNIFANNAQRTYTKEDGTEGLSQRIVVLFTDGETDSSTDTVYEYADALKNASMYGATVYCVGFGSSVDQEFLSNVSSNCYPSTSSYTYVPVYAADLDTSNTYYISTSRGGTTSYSAVTYKATGQNPGWQTSNNHGSSTVYTPKTSASDSSGTQFYSRVNSNQTATKYSMLATNQTELENIFQNISKDVTESSSSTELTDTAVLKDIISGSFDVTDATTATAESYTITTTDGETYTTGSKASDYTATLDRTTKTVSVTGFNYKEKHVSVDYPGEKLVVTITGLIPNQSGEKLYSNNNEKSGIYTDSSEETPFAPFEKPYTNVASRNVVIDFGMTADLAKNVLNRNPNATVKNGGTFTFNEASKTLTFNPAVTTADGNYTLAFSGVSSALYYGVAANAADTTANAWTKVNVIPANNVYYDDTYLNGGDTGSSDFTDGDYGYEANASASTGTTGVAAGETTFTFTGSRIDVYCTTESDSGAVIGQLKDADGNVLATKLMRNEYKSGVLYNVPTLSFETPDATATYTLTITTNDLSNYKLDGVRVYHPADETDETVQNAYAAEDESNAVFTQVRQLLLQDGFTTGSVEGAAYTDQVRDGSHITNVVSTYTDYGPKNEVYLAEGNGIAVKIDHYNPDTQRVMIGLSAPETGNGSVNLTNDATAAPLTISSVNDMYYDVTPTADGYVYIKNTGTSLIAVTNLKVTGANTGAVTYSVDEGLLAYAANFDSLEVVQPVDPTPVDPTPTAPNTTVSAIINAIWAQVRTSIGRLFGRL